LQVYTLSDVKTNIKPIFVLPNNQQPIQPMSLLVRPYRIINLVSWSLHSIGLVLSPSAALILPASPPGYCTSLLDKHFTAGVVIYRSKPCIPGTYQNKTSFGPCMICPLHSKNDGNFGETCGKCSETNTSLCFLGAINEVDIAKITTYDQAISYPESPESTQFDDLLLHNIFQLPAITQHCLVISPVFWACLTIIFCLIIFVIIKFCLHHPKYEPQRRFLKNVFTRVDFIGEGQFWLGGLISLSLFVLIIFACKFSISFAQLYPFEQTSTSERLSVSCDGVLSNAKFSSSLQLLATHKHEEEKPIFTLLDEQDINLFVQFVSTGYTCNNLEIQQNRGHGLSIPSTNFNCSENNSILNISTILPQHVVTMEFDLIGPHFVGGIRICFSAPSINSDNEKYSVQQMDYCQFFYTPNEILTSNPTISVKMTKVVNRTASMLLLSDVTYTGLWLPTLTINTLTDDVLLSQKGAFYRYLHTQMTLVVDITESEFYMKNTQEPIARTYEIIFNTILFSSKMSAAINNN
jgi:hypothetical protein